MERKQEHIENYLKSEYKGNNLLDCIYLEHTSLPEIDIKDVDLSINFNGKKIDYPFMINAMTGGGDSCCDINEDLARLCKTFNIPMAVGSQKIGLLEEEAVESFELVRENLPKNESIVIGNLSARESLDDVKKAIQMIDCDMFGLHLNPIQELIMEEGDREFRGIKDNIKNILENVDVPIIVKEVGFGMSKKNVLDLYDLGVRYIDIAGHGGTNFCEIEDNRRFDMEFSEFYCWGIPTAKILIDLKDKPDDLFLIASGGIRTAVDIVKSIVLGADMTAMSGEVLSYLMHGGYEFAKEFMDSLIYKTKMMMVMLGAKNIQELKKIDYKVFGKLKEITE
ncbi:type 2 isopentenyl-diphosphate Delta-isomerase [uncultured Finegoldia sp.]|uniref:type 2 isopentenyl-diphosphate Delta-isomerase n=1 Tax=uncultured Finegoldia sp. TaxID=328009 RepID=UPI00263006F3|nr:type 2 isopentenyl-diphosphate Delta-isomerase [uncultured Finegoldia sp.]